MWQQQLINTKNIKRKFTKQFNLYIQRVLLDLFLNESITEMQNPLRRIYLDITGVYGNVLTNNLCLNMNTSEKIKFYIMLKIKHEKLKDAINN